jgi:hypothetical protein
MKRMTAQYPLASQEKPPANAILLYRFKGIGGTAGNIPATGR